jgi:hypothetical protein
MTQCAAAASQAAVASLPTLNSSSGQSLTPSAISERLAGKRVALMFSAGWCPMCTSFEPALMQFREACATSGKAVEIIYVPSDRKEEDVIKRCTAMNMMCVPIGEEADAVKSRFKIWAGAECGKLGMGRRSGVPALVVLDAQGGEEMAFIAAESQGANALSSWPLDDVHGVW